MGIEGHRHTCTPSTDCHVRGALMTSAGRTCARYRRLALPLASPLSTDCLLYTSPSPRDRG
eukprot:1433680-Rhodomonas_salina.1